VGYVVFTVEPVIDETRHLMSLRLELGLEAWWKDTKSYYTTAPGEEEASTNEILQKLQLIGSETSALFVLDGELGKRVAK
jgi:hypothetical protein